MIEGTLSTKSLGNPSRRNHAAVLGHDQKNFFDYFARRAATHRLRWGGFFCSDERLHKYYANHPNLLSNEFFLYHKLNLYTHKENLWLLESV